MNRGITILVIIIIVLILGVGFLYFYISKAPITPPANVNQPVSPIAPRTAESEFTTLINNTENLNYDQIANKLNYLQGQLPFNFENQQFSDIDQVKNYLVNQLRNRDNYANKEAFKNIFTFIASGLFSDLITDQYKDLNNYAYYIKFKNQCPEILLSDLQNNKKKDFLANLLTESGTLEKFDFYDEYFVCQAEFNMDLCSDLTGETTFRQETVQESFKCREKTGNNLLSYYFLLSGLNCNQIGFDKISNFCQTSDCLKLCQIFRRDTPAEDLDSILATLNLTAKRIKAFYNKDENICEQIQGDGFNDCKDQVELWLALENKDSAKIRDLENNSSYISSSRYLYEYVIDNFETVSQELDNQVTNQTYDYNFNDNKLKDFCDNKFTSVIQEACTSSVQDLDASFANIFSL